MASRVGPRSVKDATRFTSTIPHATSKAANAAAPKISPAQNAANAAAKKAGRIPGETPEQRVQRLRLAHQAAQRAQISQTDRVIDASRRFLDVAHRWTVGGLVFFTVIAGIVSIYSVWDMLRYNRARRAEWVEAQRQLEDDELAVARIAYLKGKATPEQVALVEQANADAEAKGVKLPPLMAPAEHRTHFEEHVQTAIQGSAEAVNKAAGQGVLGVFSGLFGGASKKEEVSVVAPVVDTVETRAVSAQEKAQSAWDQELENQRRGGSLDQLGIATDGATKPSKKGWW